MVNITDHLLDCFPRLVPVQAAPGMGAAESAPVLGVTDELLADQQVVERRTLAWTDTEEWPSAEHGASYGLQG